MNKLQCHIRKNGFSYTLLCRTGRYAIYEQTISENRKVYEVFKIQISPEREFKGVMFAEKEIFPRDADFGITAWTYRDKHKAFNKFVSLATN